MKAKGAEIFDFYTNGWPEGWYHDDNELEIVSETDGVTSILEPDEEYDCFWHECPQCEAEKARLRAALGDN